MALEGMDVNTINTRLATASTFYAMTQRTAASVATVATFADGTTYYPVALTTAAVGTAYNFTDNNDGSFTNASGITLKVRGTVLIQGVDSVADLQLLLTAQTNESGSWAEIDTRRGSMTRTPSSSNPITYTCQYSLSLSNGKSIRPAVRAYDGTGAETFSASTITHSVWGYE